MMLTLIKLDQFQECHVEVHVRAVPIKKLGARGGGEPKEIFDPPPHLPGFNFTLQMH